MIPTFVDLLATCYKTNNFPQMETIAQSMLTIVPDNVVSLLFIGLALYQMGRMDDAYRVFKRAAANTDRLTDTADPLTCETANAALYRAAMRPHSGLAAAWHDIGAALYKLGLLKSCAQKDKFKSSIRPRPPTGIAL